MQRAPSGFIGTKNEGLIWTTTYPTLHTFIGTEQELIEK